MIKFNIENMRSAYVYITKVTSDYVYVVSHRNGEPYHVNEGISGTHYGRSITKIKIHRGVSKDFFKNNAMKEFSTPRLASLNYYENAVVSIEIQMYSIYLKGYQDADKWQSNFSKIMKELEVETSDKKEVYINGQEVFWVLDKTDTFNSYNITVDGSFVLNAVQYVNLAKMGLNLEHRENTLKEIKNKNQENVEKEDLDIKNTAKLMVKSGKVMAYLPNAQQKDKEQICVYSPVLKSSGVGYGFKKKKKKTDEDVKVFQLNSKENPCYVNIQFVMKSANTIGRLYGHDSTDFLDIPTIVAETGEINFYNIDRFSRANTPVNISAMESLAWLFGFIYKETNLLKQKELSSMFSYIIGHGLVFKNNLTVNMKEGVQEVPLVTVPSDLISIGEGVGNKFKNLRLERHKQLLRNINDSIIEKDENIDENSEVNSQ